MLIHPWTKYFCFQISIVQNFELYKIHFKTRFQNGFAQSLTQSFIIQNVSFKISYSPNISSAFSAMFEHHHGACFYNVRRNFVQAGNGTLHFAESFCKRIPFSKFSEDWSVVFDIDRSFHSLEFDGAVSFLIPSCFKKRLSESLLQIMLHPKCMETQLPSFNFLPCHEVTLLVSIDLLSVAVSRPIKHGAFLVGAFTPFVIQVKQKDKTPAIQNKNSSEAHLLGKFK